MLRTTSLLAAIGTAAIRRSDSTAATLHLQDFLGNLISRGWLANTKYLSSIEHGSEVFVGSGRLDVDSYTADIR
jgi:hypothetical protein